MPRLLLSLRPAKEVVQNIHEGKGKWVEKECDGSCPQRESGAEAAEQPHDDADD